MMQWDPILKDTENDATTFIYIHSAGVYLKQGKQADIWFDIEWSGYEGTIDGYMSIKLPVMVKKTENNPFVGTVIPSDFTLSSGAFMAIDASPGTQILSCWVSGNNVPETRQNSTPAGKLRGYIKYLID